MNSESCSNSFGLVRVFHTTTNAAEASSIKEHGFRDTTKAYLTDKEWTGVWLSDHPWAKDEVERDARVFELDLPEDELLKYAGDNRDSWREFLVPASVLNRYEIVADYSLTESLLLDEEVPDEDAADDALGV